MTVARRKFCSTERHHEQNPADVWRDPSARGQPGREIFWAAKKTAKLLIKTPKSHVLLKISENE